MGWESQGKDNLAETGEKPQLLIDRFPEMLKAKSKNIEM